MKTIITGTDFTPSSVNACKYAAFLAEKLSCKLTVFNLFEAPMIHSNIGLYGISYTSTRTTSQTRIRKVVDQLQQLYPHVQMSAFATNGVLKEELESFIASHKVEAAVMGLEAKSRISKFIYGSQGVDMAGKIDTSVIIVPENYKKRHLNKILLAVDTTEKLHKSSLKALEKFLSASSATLQLLYVRTEEELIHTPVSSLKINGQELPVQIIKAIGIEEGIKKICRRQAIDLIAIVSKKHSIFYNLFVESTTKKVAFTAKVPVLAIHE